MLCSLYDPLKKSPGVNFLSLRLSAVNFDWVCRWIWFDEKSRHVVQFKKKTDEKIPKLVTKKLKIFIYSYRHKGGNLHNL